MISNVREAFLDEGVDEQVLQELKQVGVILGCHGKLYNSVVRGLIEFQVWLTFTQESILKKIECNLSCILHSTQVHISLASGAFLVRIFPPFAFKTARYKLYVGNHEKHWIELQFQSSFSIHLLVVLHKFYNKQSKLLCHY